MDISLLAIDIDGTLVTDGDSVTPAVREAVREASAKLTVVLATGRRYRTTRQAIDQVGLALPAICLGGALTKDERGRTLHSESFAASQIERLLHLARNAGQTLLLQRDSHEHGGADFIIDDSVAWNENVRHYMVANGPVGHVDRAPETTGYEDILMVGCFAERDALVPLQRAIDADGAFATVLVQSKKTPGWYLETTLRRANKWTGLTRFAAARGIAETAICAVGDALNDLPMIRGAGFGVAMGNAEPTVRKAADWVTGSNAEDGVATLIERLLAKTPPAERRPRPCQA